MGTEPGSKAYRLLNPVTNRVEVSRDVVFSEEKEWSWIDTEETEHAMPGEFIVNVNKEAISPRNKRPHQKKTPLMTTKNMSSLKTKKKMMQSRCNSHNVQGPNPLISMTTFYWLRLKVNGY